MSDVLLVIVGATDRNYQGNSTLKSLCLHNHSGFTMRTLCWFNDVAG